jgi:hypothetical protein
MPRMIRRVGLVIGFFVLCLNGCSSGDEVKIDYTVSFTDIYGKQAGTVDSGSVTGIGSNVPAKALKGSTATFEVKSDMAGLHFTIVDEGMRKGHIVCTAQPGSGSASAQANVMSGGHYLIALNYKGSRCLADQ